MDNVRTAANFAVSNIEQFNTELLVRADLERQHDQYARSYSPFLHPAAIGAAALDSRFGERWIDELVKDCPQFSAVVVDLVLRRALAAYPTSSQKRG